MILRDENRQPLLLESGAGTLLRPCDVRLAVGNLANQGARGLPVRDGQARAETNKLARAG